MLWVSCIGNLGGVYSSFIGNLGAMEGGDPTVGEGEDVSLAAL